MCARSSFLAAATTSRLSPTAASGSRLRGGPAGSGSRSRSGSRPPVWFASKPDRHFFGHGAFSADGRLLYATENDYERARGMIGVRDATDGYRQIGEFPAHGMEPHDIALLDGRPHHGDRQWRHPHPSR